MQLEETHILCAMTNKEWVCAGAIIQQLLQGVCACGVCWGGGQNSKYK